MLIFNEHVGLIQSTSVLKLFEQLPQVFLQKIDYSEPKRPRQEGDEDYYYPKIGREWLYWGTMLNLVFLLLLLLSLLVVTVLLQKLFEMCVSHGKLLL
jgi:hypothetical protein